MRLQTKGLLLVAGATFFWSLSGAFVRFLPSTDPWTFNAWRGLGMGLSLIVWTLLHYGRGALPLLRQSDPRAILIAATFFGIGSSAYIAALNMASVAAVSCLGATSGLFAAVLARIWLGERTRMVFYLATAVAMVGVAVIAFSERNAHVSGLAGSLVAMVMAVCFAGQSVALRRYSAQGMEPAMIVGGLGVFVTIATFGTLAPVGGDTILLLFLMGAVQLALPMVLYMRGARHVPVTQMVLITMSDAFLNPLWVWLVFGELPVAGVFWGGALILGAIAATTVHAHGKTP
ncbi:MAG: DMT family transporter [Rhodoferax sp.]|nr:DMT family transporter [Rhodoferax sp.]